MNLIIRSRSGYHYYYKSMCYEKLFRCLLVQLIPFQPGKDVYYSVICLAFYDYSDGTTDVTRTFHFGQPTDMEIVRQIQHSSISS